MFFTKENFFVHKSAFSLLASGSLIHADRQFLRRCAALASLADGQTGNNPRVGAVLVSGDRIIGEGYHRRAGTAHAEVNCLASVKATDRGLIAGATLYISLEPCCIEGRTGACTNVIRANRIGTVVFGQRDPTPGVAGRSVGILEAAGITVREYPAFEPTRLVNTSRRVMTLQGRPYVTLKYARSADGFLRPADRAAAYWITSPLSRRLVHRWRADHAAILVGARTAVEDDPVLTTRLFPGPDPRPVVWDPRDRLAGRERLFTSAKQQPLVFSGRPRPELAAKVFKVTNELDEAAGAQVLGEVLRQGHGSLLVEGGAAILSFFLRAGHWDEARLLVGPVRYGKGLPAPLPDPDRAVLTDSRALDGGDTLEVWRNEAPRPLPATQRT